MKTIYLKKCVNICVGVQMERVSLVDLFDFVLWFIACLLFVKFFKLDFAYVVYIGLDWRFVEMLTRKAKEEGDC